MGVSPKAKAEDTKFLRRFKKLRPKARFKELSKQDQFVITAHAFSKLLARPKKGGLDLGQMITVRTIDPRYVEREAASGWLTKNSELKIKRAATDAFKRVLGKDACFMFVIEQQDKEGNPCAPHIHALAKMTLLKHNIHALEAELQKVAGDNQPNTIRFTRSWCWISKHPSERNPGEADLRRAAQYFCKNDQTKQCRSQSLMQHVHETFEELKRHHGVAA